VTYTSIPIPWATTIHNLDISVLQAHISRIGSRKCICKVTPKHLLLISNEKQHRLV